MLESHFALGFDVSSPLALLKKDIDRVNEEDGSNNRGTDKELLAQFEKNGFRVDPRDRESYRIFSENKITSRRRASAKKWLLGAVNFNIHYKAMSLGMHYHAGQRAWCSLGPGTLPGHYRLPDGSSEPHANHVPLSVTMGANSNVHTYIHEYGHAIKGWSSEANELCTEFLKRRRRPGEKLKRILDLNSPKELDFHPDEGGFDDNFARVFRAVGHTKKNSEIYGR